MLNCCLRSLGLQGFSISGVLSVSFMFPAAMQSGSGRGCAEADRKSGRGQQSRHSADKHFFPFLVGGTDI